MDQVNYSKWLCFLYLTFPYRGLRQHKTDCIAWQSACLPAINNEPLKCMEIQSPAKHNLTPTVMKSFTPKYRQTYNNIGEIQEFKCCKII